MNETLKVIRERRSTRKFKSEQIKNEELEALLEAGIYAPSAHNQQSWNFTVIQNQQLLEELNVNTKAIAKHSSNETIQKMGSNDKFHIFYGAPTVIIVSGKEDAISPYVDCAAASENILIAAESLNIGGCWNGIVGVLFNSDRNSEYKEKLKIPNGYTPYYAIALGYKDAPSTKARERRSNTVQYIK